MHILCFSETMVNTEIVIDVFFTLKPQEDITRAFLVEMESLCWKREVSSRTEYNEYSIHIILSNNNMIFSIHNWSLNVCNNVSGYFFRVK